MRTPFSGALSLFLLAAGLDLGAALVTRGDKKGRQPAAEGANGTWTLFPDGSLPGPVPNLLDVTRARQLQAAVDVACKVSYPTGNIYMVTRPSIVPYLVDAKHPRRSNVSVLVLPGGAKMFLAWEREGDTVAQWLNSIGVSAFVLRYRVPAPAIGADAMLIDTQRAMSVLRYRAESLGLSPQRIGIMGFSAGGILLPELASVTRRLYPSRDEADAVSFVPAFHMMIYGLGPGIIKPEARPPPTFAVNARDDPCVNAVQGEAYCRAVSAVGGYCEHHMYPSGGHGYGTCAVYTNAWTGSSVCEWTHEAERFLGQMALS